MTSQTSPARGASTHRPWQLAGLTLCIAVGLLAWLGQQVAKPLVLTAPTSIDVVRGDTLAVVLRRLSVAGYLSEPRAVHAWARLTGRGDRIVAGEYALDPGITPARLLADFASGRQRQYTVRIAEGGTFRQALEALWASPVIKPTLRGRSDADIMNALGIGDLPAEGWFFPDTYFITRNETDLDVLRRSHAAMQEQLAAQWQTRGPGAPQSAGQALILASLVEKETARAEERPLIAAVLLNRLRLGMPLQIDSTVIYGLGEKFAGNLTRRDLRTPTPHNTYTLSGLPPTPIALPGLSALQAVTHPAAVDYLYFVARGDGTHHFSRTLAEHNRAVDCYQRLRPAGCAA